jgi:PLP dependent protein
MVSTASALASLRERFENVRSRIDARAQLCNRSPEGITLVAITKTHPVDVIRSALEIGIKDLGENRVQEAEPKIKELGRSAAHWHLVGHLQANKARRAVRLFDIIHSVDSTALAERLDRICIEEGCALLPVLVQVDLAGEETKSGIAENRLEKLADTIVSCHHLQMTGLMTLPPFFEDAERARPYFRRLRELRDELRSRGYFGERQGDLSMGMTNDFELAIEEGATIVRVGTALFGERKPDS